MFVHDIAAPTLDGLPLLQASIPIDPASIFVYALLVAAGVGIWKGSRSG